MVIYCHGGGWIHGDAQTYDRLIREIAVGAGVAVVFIGHDRSPQAQYPVAIEQTYAVLLHLTTHAQTLNVDATRIAIAGDDTGGAIAAAVTLLVRERRGPKLDLQVLICPITNADFDTLSYLRFADGPWLTRAAMQHAWDAYLPDAARRAEPHAAPLRASLDQLAQLPEALVIVAENDVARDDGENYARRLSDAGVRVTSVRYNGTIHDFVVLNALADTPAARGAIEQIICALKSVLGLTAWLALFTPPPREAPDVPSRRTDPASARATRLPDRLPPAPRTGWRSAAIAACRTGCSRRTSASPRRASVALSSTSRAGVRQRTELRHPSRRVPPARPPASCRTAPRGFRGNTRGPLDRRCPARRARSGGRSLPAPRCPPRR